MPEKPICTVTLQQAVYGGDCLARLEDGRALFVPFGIPGETARVEIIEEKRAFARGRILEVITPSAGRIKARCPHFGVCGGCHYQHLPYPNQLIIKQAVVVEQFQRIAGINNPPVNTIIPSEKKLNYRNSLQFHLDPAGKLGFQAPNSHQVVAVGECHLPEVGLDEVWRQFEIEPLPGLERIEFRLDSNDEVMVVLESSSIEMPEVEIESPISLIHSSPAGQVVISGDESLVFRIREREFIVSAASFFQVNSSQTEKMVNYLLEKVPFKAQDLVLDVYCGVGLFSAFLAPIVGEVVGIEYSPSACRDFAVNLDEFENVSLYEGAAEEILQEIDFHPDVVIVDPPRAGLDGRALDAIVAKQPPIVVYVSCDPSTLARDVKRFINAGYKLAAVQPFDLFPQTYHVETIVQLER